MMNRIRPYAFCRSPSRGQRREEGRLRVTERDPRPLAAFVFKTLLTPCRQDFAVPYLFRTLSQNQTDERELRKKSASAA